MIHIEDLTKSYGPHRVLEGIDLHVAAGEIVLLLGANGAGKSTLFRCVLGIVPYAGSIRVDGLDPLRDGRDVRMSVGYMPQRDGLHEDMTVAETISFYAQLRSETPARARALLEEARLQDAAANRVEEISGGMRQRLAFALALLSDPPVLLLDEPTASLDGWSRDFLIERVQELAARGKTVLLSTHAQHPPLHRMARPLTLRRGRLYDEAAARAEPEVVA